MPQKLAILWLKSQIGLRLDCLNPNLQGWNRTLVGSTSVIRRHREPWVRLLPMVHPARWPMPSEGIQGDEWGAYVVLARFAVTEHGMAYRTRVPRSRSAKSTRGSHAPPGRTGEPCTGGSGTGGRMSRACEVREMRNAEAGLVMRRAILARGHWRAA